MIFRKAHLDEDTVKATIKGIEEDTIPELRDPKNLKQLCQGILDNPGLTHKGLQNKIPTVSYKALSELFRVAEERYYELGGKPPFPELDPNTSLAIEDLFR